MMEASPVGDVGAWPGLVGTCMKEGREASLSNAKGSTSPSISSPASVARLPGKVSRGGPYRLFALPE